MNLTCLLFAFVLLSFACFSSCQNGNFTLDNTKTKIKSKKMWNETALDRLKKDLFVNYDKYSRPQELDNSTNLRIGLALSHLETDEAKSTITLHAWIRLLWDDSKLKWNSSDYDGVDVARLANHEIWQPDLYLYNSITGGEPIFRYSSPNVLIYPNGEVLFVPPTKLRAVCVYDFRHWPFDTQICTLKIGSWIHSGKEINMTLYNNEKNVSIEVSQPSTSWNVINTTAEIVTKHYECCPEPYYYAQFNFTISRKSDIYRAVVVTPATVLAMFILVQFWLSPKSKEKLMLNCVTAIILVMYLTYFSGQVFGIGKQTPLIIIFYSTSLYLVCVSIITTTLGSSFSEIKQTRFLPWLFNKHLNGKLGKLLLLDYHLKEDSMSFCTKVPQQEGGYSKATFDQQGWIFAIAINRLLFFVYLIIFVVFGLVYLC